jgi:RimJ/RimL family protein N-acetyltransferase
LIPRPKPPRTLAIEEVRTRLLDGTRILVRPIRPDDKPLLREGFDRLSAESRLRRFMAPITDLDAEQLHYLTEVDYVNHFAWVAVLAERPDFGIGVGRYIRLEDAPEVAEVAITVVDDYQGKGLGTLLLGMLAATARAAGVRKFRAYVLEDNLPMRTLMSQLGVETRHDAPGVLIMDAEIDPARLPDSPAGLALKAIARRLLPARARVEM